MAILAAEHLLVTPSRQRNIGIAFGTLVGGLVVTHAGLGEVGLVGGILGVLSCICAAIARRFWQRMQDSSPDRS